MTEMEREVIRSTYRSLTIGSLLSRRDRLVLAGIPLAESVAKDFWHTYPSRHYAACDMKSEAMIALVKAAERAADGRVHGDVVSYLCGAIWADLVSLRDESPPIGPGADTVAKLRRQQQAAGETVISIHDEPGREVDVPVESAEAAQADLLDELLESCCLDLLDRSILIYRRDGYDNERIAKFTGFSARTVARRLAAIHERHLALGA